MQKKRRKLKRATKQGATSERAFFASSCWAESLAIWAHLGRTVHLNLWLYPVIGNLNVRINDRLSPNIVNIANGEICLDIQSILKNTESSSLYKMIESRLQTGLELLIKINDTQVFQTIQNLSIKLIVVIIFLDKYSSQFGGGSQYAYFHEEDEASFQLVDTTRTQKTAYQRNRMRFAQRNLRRDKDRRNILQFNLQTLPKSAKQKERDRLRLQKKFQKQFGVRQKWDQKSQKPRDSSVEVRSDWEVKEEMDFPRLMKMRYLEVSEPQDIECCGALEHYDKGFDRITTRNERNLRSIKRIFHTVTTTDDPVIRKLAKTQGNVFATDAILATLMSCTRSVYSWDIIVQRVGSKLFFDKRDNSDFDLLTVSETANEPPQDEGNSFNSPRNLAMEATYINHNFSQQCLRMGKEKFTFPNPNPFVEDDMDKNEVASVAYRYRRWKLGDDIDLIVRCEHDGVMIGANGEVSFINIKTLNEWDSRHCNGVDWRQKLDSQRGAVIATELKNNSYKLARWTTCALLAGSEYLKLGYVSRYHVKDSSRHVILGTQQFKPNEFASQINLIMENAWGILRCVIDICMKLDEGKYLILKDPNKQVIRVYSLPDGTFSSDEEEDEEEEEEEEEVLKSALNKVKTPYQQHGAIVSEVWARTFAHLCLVHSLFLV
ncbi:hypothetical protein E2320_004121 [Naja naja]|nr:hypothetical protein E2320_004121 [Naja naja]